MRGHPEQGVTVWQGGIQTDSLLPMLGGPSNRKHTAAPNAATGIPRPKLKVLVVDESPIVRERIAGMIERLPAVDLVGEAGDDVQARDLFRARLPDVVILDVELADARGLELLDHFKRERPGCRVIVFTASEHAEIKQQCLQHATDFYFHKAREFEAMLDLLGELATPGALPASDAHPQAAVAPAPAPTSTSSMRPSAGGPMPLLYPWPDPEFDDLLRLASTVCGTSMAFLCLVDANRYRLTSCVGCEVAHATHGDSLCDLTLEGTDLQWVQDAAADPRYAGHPMVKGPAGVRLFAGIPLRMVPGPAVGMLAVMDRAPREPDASQGNSLRALARQVESLLKLRFAQEALARTTRLQRSALASGDDGFCVVDRRGRIAQVNNALVRQLGYSREDLLRRRLTGLVEGSALLAFSECLRRAREMGAERIETRLRREDGRMLEAEVRVEYAPLEEACFLVLIRDLQQHDKRKLDPVCLNRAVDQAAEAIVITDLQGSIQYVNPAFERITGYTEAEVMGRNPRVLKSGRHEPRFYRQLWQTISAGGVWSGRFINRRKDGTLYEEEATISPVAGEFGQITRFIAVKQDVTAQRTAEQALRESEGRFRALADSSGDAILCADEAGIIRYSNRAAATMFGRTGGELRGRPVTDLMPERFRASHDEVLRRVRSGDAPGSAGRTLESVGLRQDGTEFPLELSFSVWQAQGRVSFGAVIRDLTERKKEAEALVHSEARFRALLESSTDAVLTLFPPECRLASANGAALNLFGVDHEQDLCSCRLEELSPERQPDGRESAAGTRRMVETALERGFQFLEWTLRRSDGATFPATILLTRVDLDGRTGLQATIREVGRRNAVAGPERSAVADWLTRQSETEIFENLVNGVAHAIEDSIQGIVEAAGLIDSDVRPESTAAAYAVEIRREAGRLAGFVHNLLRDPRLERAEHKPACIAILVRGTIARFRKLLGKDQTRLEVCLPEDLPRVVCRAQQIQQVLLNLFLNVAGALNPPGAEPAPAREVRVGANAFERADVTWVRLTVESQGGGIPEELVRQWLEPSVTVGGDPAEPGPSLLVGRNILRQHGGELHWETEAGVCTRFHVELPAQREPARVSEAEAA